MQYRGPAKAIFEKMGAISVTGGEAITHVSFSAPGAYALRAIATDGALSVASDILIVVKQ
jgi:hypothetical protein